MYVVARAENVVNTLFCMHELVRSYYGCHHIARVVEATGQVCQQFANAPHRQPEEQSACQSAGNAIAKPIEALYFEDLTIIKTDEKFDGCAYSRVCGTLAVGIGATGRDSWRLHHMRVVGA